MGLIIVGGVLWAWYRRRKTKLQKWGWEETDDIATAANAESGSGDGGSAWFSIPVEFGVFSSSGRDLSAFYRSPDDDPLADSDDDDGQAPEHIDPEEATSAAQSVIPPTEPRQAVSRTARRSMRSPTAAREVELRVVPGHVDPDDIDMDDADAIHVKDPEVVDVAEPEDVDTEILQILDPGVCLADEGDAPDSTLATDSPPEISDTPPSPVPDAMSSGSRPSPVPDGVAASLEC